MNVSVITSHELRAQSPTQLTVAEGKLLLTGNHRTAYAERSFPECDDLETPWAAAYISRDQPDQKKHGFESVSDVFNQKGQSLHIRCSCSDDPSRPRKELSRRELVFPVLFAAAFLAGNPLRNL